MTVDLTAGLPAGWTREPLPDGVSAARLGTPCRTCGSQVDSPASGLPPMTRTIEREPGVEYMVQLHHDWCPVYTGITPDLPCPACGIEVTGYDYQPGMVAAVPDARFGTAHLVGAAEEILDQPAAQSMMAKLRREPAFDRLTVQPCGDVLEGDHVHQVLRRAGQLRAERARAAMTAKLEAAQPILDATKDRWPTVFLAYLAAIADGSATEPGLREALRLLAETTEGASDIRPPEST